MQTQTMNISEKTGITFIQGDKGLDSLYYENLLSDEEIMKTQMKILFIMIILLIGAIAI